MGNMVIEFSHMWNVANPLAVGFSYEWMTTGTSKTAFWKSSQALLITLSINNFINKQLDAFKSLLAMGLSWVIILHGLQLSVSAFCLSYRQE